MPPFFKLLTRFRKDERGIFGVIFGLIAVVLVTLAGCVVDFSYMQTIRSRAQNALDASALALQSKMSTLTVAEIQAQAQALLIERLADSTVTAEILSVTKNTSVGTLNLKAHIRVPTIFVQLVGVRNLDASLVSEVTQNSSNVEVSVSLDVTGSMAGTKITDLQDATSQLIDLVVKDTQTPSYSRMAIVPWSFGANLGTQARAALARGTPATVTGSITSSAWAVASSQKSISAVNVVYNGAVTITTSSNHGRSTGDVVYITGMTAGCCSSGAVTNLNGNYYTVTKVNNTKFTLNNVTGSANTTGSGGTETACQFASCNVQLTGTFSATSFHDGDGVYVSGVSGLTNLNSTGYFITYTDSTHVILKNSTAASNQYNSGNAGTGGTLTRANYGDVYYHFTAADSSQQTYQPSTCTTERATDTSKDTSPATYPLGFDYTSGGAACVSQTMQPLTDSKTTLHALATSLSAGGSTSGHLGLAWGWYLISPNFSTIWPSVTGPPATYVPHAYKEANLVKAIVFMTDGDFNSPYCKGVIASDAGSGSGGGNTHNSCSAPLGTSQVQAQALCDEIKKSTYGIILYVVGFDLAGNTTALNFLQGCATDTTKFFQADDGTDLANAFTAIAGDLSQLRLSK